MEIIPCGNHACTARFDKANDEYHTCALCLAPAYCSDECRLADWRAHDCPNVHKTEDIKQGFAVPYFYEDMLTQDELEDVPVGDPIFQSHQVMHCNANRTISEYLVPSLVDRMAESKDDEAPIARGKNPKQLQGATAYTLKIGIGGKLYDINGKIPHDMIYKENTTNETARALSGGGATFKERAKNILKGGLRRALHHAETSYIFWPSNQEVRRNFIEVPLAGDVAVTLWINGEVVSYVAAGYKLPVPGKSDVMAASRKVQQIFRQQIEMKFKGSDLSTKNLYVRRYSDFEGNSVVLTFEITPGSYKAKLVDLEFLTDAERVKSTSKDEDTPPPPPPADNPPADTKSEIISSRYTCNVRDFEEVVGLAMALDTFIASPPINVTNLKDLEAKASIIKEYAHKMHDNQGEAPAVIPPEVDTAIMVALNAMYEPIGLTAKEWERNIKSSDLTRFKNDVQAVITRLKTLQQKDTGDASTVKGKVLRRVNTVQQNTHKNDLKRALKAISDNSNILRQTTKWQEIEDLRKEIESLL